MTTPSVVEILGKMAAELRDPDVSTETVADRAAFLADLFADLYLRVCAIQGGIVQSDPTLAVWIENKLDEYSQGARP
jgi:hypothetical protein